MVKVTLFAIILSSIFLSCKPKPHYKSPTVVELNEVANAFLNADYSELINSTDSIQNKIIVASTLSTICLNKQVEDCKINFHDYNDFFSTNQEAVNFTKEDISYLNFQFLDTTSIFFELSGSPCFELLDADDLIKKKIPFIHLSKPYFSKNHNNAFIEKTFVCYGLCGSCTRYYLQKVDGKWEVIDTQLIWIS